MQQSWYVMMDCEMKRRAAGEAALQHPRARLASQRRQATNAVANDN